MGVYYKKIHKIAGINFLPRLTLAEYNNLTVKPEHWIRTDSPFDYSKTDIPKLTLTQYQDLAIKPKFWIRTDAPQSYTTISATQVDVTDSVSVKDYLDNLDATQVNYDSNNSVKDKIDEVATDSGWITLNQNHNVKYRKVGKQVQGVVSTQISEYTIFGALPQGFRPTENMLVYNAFTDISNGQSALLIVRANGSVEATNIKGTGSNYFSATLTYFVG